MSNVLHGLSQLMLTSTLWKIPKEMGISDHIIFLLRNLYAGQEATIKAGHGEKKKAGHGTTDWLSKLGKGYIKAAYGHPAYLTYMQSTSCEMLG